MNKQRFMEDLRRCRLALAVYILYFAIFTYCFGTVCPMVLLFGIPCPACGLTHAGLFVLTGQWREAWAWNPAIFLWIPLILYAFLTRYVLWKKKYPLLLFAIITAIATIIIYMIRFVYGEMVPVEFPGFVPGFIETLRNILYN